MKKIFCLMIFCCLGLALTSFCFAQYDTAESKMDDSLLEEQKGETPAKKQMDEFLSEEQADQDKTSKIVKVIDIQGNKTIGTTAILAKIKIRVGDEYSSNIAGDDIKRLFNTGYFSDVAIEKEDYEGGVKVIIYLTEKPVIDKITFSKTTYYSTRALTLKIESKEGRFFDRKNLKEDKKIIADLYAKKGLTDVVIDVDVTTDEQNSKVTLHYIIEEGQRVKIKKINISGNKFFSYKQIIRAIKTRADSLFTSGYLKSDILEEDMERIAFLYADDGFLDAKATYAIEQVEKSKLIINISVEEGKQYFVGDIVFEGNDIVFTDKEIVEALGELKSDETFTPKKMDEAISRLNSNYFDKGYIFVNIQDATSINPETGKVDVRLNIQEGDIAYVNKINIQGNTRTRDIVVRRELRLKPGDVFDGAKLRRSKERLKNLGYFEEIDYDVQDTSYSNKKDLVVQVKEAKTGSFSFGGGYSTVDQLVGFFEIEQKNFDFANWPTFTGGGQDILVRAELGSVRNNARLSFTEPWIFDYPISGGFDLYQTKTDRESDTGYAYDEERTGGDLRLGKQLTEYLSAGTVYRMEEITISNLDTSAGSELQKEVGTNTISSLSFSLTHDSRDNIFSPTKGLVLGGTFDYAGGFLGGDKNFYRIQTRTSYLVPILDDTVLEFRLRTGLVTAFGDSDEVPIYERFFAGGARTIRGYDERKVGPLDSATNDPIGGDSLLIFNVEYTIPLVDFIKLATFFDVGNVWTDMEDFGTGDLKSGTGLGLRIKTPIGPINLDYGYPLNDVSGEDDRTGKFYFSISRSF
ncbi:MAG: outer membrane protein assembly factor BamA [Candidatus Omnitrophica bacterium]|nr:outer membrane protein assembly factor BamA [Candidatus Omnitrophota bacterium]